MTECSFLNCHLETHEEANECILHCTKEKYQIDFQKPGFLDDFYQALSIYISEFVFRANKEGTTATEKN